MRYECLKSGKCFENFENEAANGSENFENEAANGLSM